MSGEYQESVKAAFPHRIEVGTIPGAGDSTFVVVGFELRLAVRDDVGAHLTDDGDRT